MGKLPRNTTRRQGEAAAAAPPRDPARIARLAELLAATWPDATCELDHRNAFELLVATILAAQSTDKLVNTVTPALFARWPDATALAAVDQAELEPMVHATGFFRMKAKHVLAMARALVERHGGEVPARMEDLVALPGVARKTANVVLGTCFGIADGVVVDTHVTRLSQRLGLTVHTDPVKIEQDLMAQLPRDQWISFANRLIWHGRRTCFARAPACDRCPLAPLCPAAQVPGHDAAAAPATPARAARAAKPAKPPKPAKPAKPAKTPKPAKPAKPAKPTVKPAGGAKKRGKS
ncbi:MAG: endonuclease III [Kofleriaceae bacterium]|nr:endonuclease III [Kofleriaceae bacterium]